MCSYCCGKMKVIALIDDVDVIERIQYQRDL